MIKVNHKTFGTGEVINKYYEGNNLYIDVKFEGRDIMTLSNSTVSCGIITVEGELKEEMDKVIEENNARISAERKKTGAYIAAPTPVTPSSTRRAGGTHKRTPIKGVTESAYEDYLVLNGYKEYTQKGNPSTVFSYANAINLVLDEEHLTWEGLRDNICRVIPIYDVGGRKQDIGSKSNKTVINALKRFKEFVEA